MNLSSQRTEAYWQFVTKCKRISTESNLYFQYHVYGFFNENQAKIDQLIEIMGDDGIKWMSDQVAWSLNTLERKLYPIKVLSSEHVNQLKKNYTANKNKDCVTCIIIFSVLADYEIPVSDLNYNEPLLPQLAKKLISLLLGKGTSAENPDHNKILEIVGIKRILQLMIARDAIRDQNYEDVYLKLLEHYLLKSSDDVNRFLHDIEQDDELGKKLAYHNNKIRNKLKSSIDPENALSYKEQNRVTIQPDGTIELKPKHDSQDDDTQKLINLIKEYEIPNNGEDADKIRRMTKTLIALKKQFTDNKKKNASEKSKQNKLHDECTVNLIVKLANQSNALGAKNQFKGIINLATKLNIITSKSMENGETRHINATKTADEKKAAVTEQAKNSNKKYNFIIKQWSKTEIETLFLGDYVGCCLATDGIMSSKMVQRIMDDAVLFHVAIDENTKKPAALLWLFLAETDDDEIVLVANFCDVNVKYAKNASLRQSLLNSLLFYTYQYIQDNRQIKQFYLRQLTHGNNEGDLDGFPKKVVSLKDKLGGAFNPTDQNDYIRTDDAYYLYALVEKNKLHILNHNALFLQDEKFCEQIKKYCNEDLNLITRMNYILCISAEIQDYIGEYLANDRDPNDDLLKKAGIIYRVCESELPFDINKELCLEFLKRKCIPDVNLLDGKIASSKDIALLFFWLKKEHGNYEIIISKIGEINSLQSLMQLIDVIDDDDFNNLCLSIPEEECINMIKSFEDLKLFSEYFKSDNKQAAIIDALPAGKLINIIESVDQVKQLKEMFKHKCKHMQTIIKRVAAQPFILEFVEDKKRKDTISYDDLELVFELTSDFDNRNKIIKKYKPQLAYMLGNERQWLHARFTAIFTMLNEDGKKYLINLFTAKQLTGTFSLRSTFKKEVGDDLYKWFEDGLSKNDASAAAFITWASKEGINELIKVLKKIDKNKRYELLKSNQESVRKVLSDNFDFALKNPRVITELLSLTSKQIEEFITEILGVNWIREQILDQKMVSRVMYQLLFYNESVYNKIIDDSSLEKLKNKAENKASFWIQVFHNSQNKILVSKLINKLGDEYIKKLEYSDFTFPEFIKQLPENEGQDFIGTKEPSAIKYNNAGFFAVLNYTKPCVEAVALIDQSSSDCPNSTIK